MSKRDLIATTLGHVAGDPVDEHDLAVVDASGGEAKLHPDLRSVARGQGAIRDGPILPMCEVEPGSTDEVRRFVSEQRFARRIRERDRAGVLDDDDRRSATLEDEGEPVSIEPIDPASRGWTTRTRGGRLATRRRISTRLATWCRRASVAESDGSRPVGGEEVRGDRRCRIPRFGVGTSVRSPQQLGCIDGSPAPECAEVSC
jgi:hypothetical protein